MKVKKLVDQNFILSKLNKRNNVFIHHTAEVSENATVRRDGEKASLRDVFVGDKVVLTITRGDISKIIATVIVLIWNYLARKIIVYKK